MQRTYLYQLYQVDVLILIFVVQLLQTSNLILKKKKRHRNDVAYISHSVCLSLVLFSFIQNVTCCDVIFKIFTFYFSFRLLGSEGMEVINPEGGKEDAEEEAQRGRWRQDVGVFCLYAFS